MVYGLVFSYWYTVIQGRKVILTILHSIRHPELVSGSVRGETLILARCEMLKRVIRLRSSRTSLIT